MRHWQFAQLIHCTPFHCSQLNLKFFCDRIRLHSFTALPHPFGFDFDTIVFLNSLAVLCNDSTTKKSNKKEGQRRVPGVLKWSVYYILSFTRFTNYNTLDCGLDWHQQYWHLSAALFSCRGFLRRLPLQLSFGSLSLIKGTLWFHRGDFLVSNFNRLWYDQARLIFFDNKVYLLTWSYFSFDWT